MKNTTFAIHLLLALFVSGCATTASTNTLKSYPEIGSVLRKQAKVGVVGYPAANLEAYNIKAVAVDKPTTDDQQALRSFLREKMIESLIIIDTSRKEEGPKTSSNFASSMALTAAKTLLAIATKSTSVSSGSSYTETTTPAKTTISCNIVIYGADGVPLMKETSEDVFSGTLQKNEDYVETVLIKALSLFRMKDG
jgi:hypothetical protein